MFSRVVGMRYSLGSPKRMWTINRLLSTAASQVPPVVQELLTIIPDTYVDMSTVSALYEKRFNKKLHKQSGANNLRKLFTEFPDKFTTVRGDAHVSQSLVKSLVSDQDAQNPLATQPLSLTSATPSGSALFLNTQVLKAPAERKKKKQKLSVEIQLKDKQNTEVLEAPVGPSQEARKLPVKIQLNERSEQLVSLAGLTASLRHVETSIPRKDLASFVFTNSSQQFGDRKIPLITDRSASDDTIVGSSILGFNAEGSESSGAGDNAVFMNTTDPFCAVCIGVQGAGKSHSMNVILENCLLNTVQTNGRTIVSSPQPMCGLVLHYDQSESNCCESVGLQSPAAPLSQLSELKVQRLVVLASPTYYLQRKAFYGDTCEVIPLLFKWDTLTATQLKKLMRLSDSDAQLYVSVILNKLREYQRKNKIPSFEGFLEEVIKLCNVKGQSAPLIQRLDILKTIVRESEANQHLRNDDHSLASLMKAGTLVVADLTDPMMSADEACGVFQVLLEQFRGHPLGDVGKVVTFDEAHKYLSKDGPGCVELTGAIVDTVRLMRHEGIRVLISTQSPLTMPPELLELTSVTVLHKFQSADWARYLGSKITLPAGGFSEIQSLGQGQALLLSTQISSAGQEGVAERAGVNHLKVNIRPRLTLDLGASRRNRAGAEGKGPVGVAEEQDGEAEHPFILEQGMDAKVEGNYST